ncbi:aminopeptidase P family protein [Calothrix sp. 336/3]|uniref:aminopeptidase P family protein n=1 Tax=Calothrix sp. 336/3 TaxID=1337936 RepID=UPI0004E45B05|nr:aminopeptidase P family protein [Calothrix sp. 336/3]AKG24753.1 aminopeptidase [Calothrix sp. 336/3]
MLPLEIDNSLLETLRQRRQNLHRLVDFPVVLWSGGSTARNFPANIFPFRASSHFLYFTGLPLRNAAIRLQGGNLELFLDEAPASNALWYGETPSIEEIGAKIGAIAVYPMAELAQRVTDAATIAVQDAATWTLQSQLLNRWVLPQQPPQDIDWQLAKAIIQLRLTHDTGAIAELRKASEVTVAAHRAGMLAVRSSQGESQVRAAMEQVIMAHNMTTAYSSIVTVHGEVLHNDSYHHSLTPGNLLLADVGAETPGGWAADITRTFPVNGKFSPTQRAIYQVIWAAQQAAIAMVKPGIEYADVHREACLAIASGLVDLGILRGEAEDLVHKNLHALFFPHGIGHLLGLDVHDMEDLGDLAGYGEGRTRSDRFGLSYLRLNRPLEPGMLVTIEPGFYQVPAILNDPKVRSQYQYLVNWERLAEFADVRGIRIEDDVLVTSNGHEVLTAALPSQIDMVEELVQQG